MGKLICIIFLFLMADANGQTDTIIYELNLRQSILDKDFSASPNANASILKRSVHPLPKLQHQAFFCRHENRRLLSGAPVFFRLGTLETVDKLEGKAGVR